MPRIKKNIISGLFSFSILMGSTPLEYTLSLTGGYDNNVMRFSKDEFQDAANNRSLMGGASTFDSFVSKLGISARKPLWINGKKSIQIYGFFSYSDYQHTPEKKYESYGLDLSFKRGSYKSIKYSVRHLDKFYLRHYVDRDISTDALAACLFTDRNQSVTLTERFSKKVWINLGAGFLQRYYEKPFSEFDLDIVYLKGKLNYKIKKVGSISVQINRGSALSESHFDSRPSSFNRSYETMEWYVPFKMTKNVPWFKEIGFSAREETRIYEAEDPNDPLHAGRSHTDSKYDVWLKKNLVESVDVIFTTRYRVRTTNSAYDWVTDLKSFKQIQCWLKIEWDLHYDRY